MAKNRIEKLPGSLFSGMGDVYVDRETGVEYLVFDNGSGVAVTPLYTQEGAIKVNQEYAARLNEKELAD
ncbi:DUF6440 family protein [Vagococcus acidifermentans]|uniref:DUF6440 domain-containing protein n=1 Tax=Vagococcus acidifermentans TaxID=564710 RepID=A0A430B0R9_9ENTE|nr:DUF6440 family protein [Vagococcus acidifermentans]RSU13918.1 hypothetical protein CBF27_03180 [Vagococcus acidifermentans]